MTYDPDAGLKRREDIEDLDKLLSALQDLDLSAWDTDFVNDMTDRLGKYGESAHVTGKQWEQLERMRNQYHVKI